MVPSFDTSERHAGAILTLSPAGEDLARAEIQRLLGLSNCEPEDLVRGVMDAIGHVVPFDAATFGIYTEDLRHFQTLVVHPQPDWEWTTASFPLGPNSAGQHGSARLVAKRRDMGTSPRRHCVRTDARA